MALASQIPMRGEQSGVRGRAMCWGDVVVTPLAPVLWPWRDICGLGATSGWPRRREGHACCPPEGHEPSETHHPMTWSSPAARRAMFSQTSGACICLSAFSKPHPVRWGLQNGQAQRPELFICEVSGHRAQLAQPCWVSQRDSSKQTGDADPGG